MAIAGQANRRQLLFSMVARDNSPMRGYLIEWGFAAQVEVHSGVVDGLYALVDTR